MANKFWMVMKNESGDYVPDNTMPTMKHRVKSDAVAEAKRLAAKCPGYEFVVLECVGSATTNTVTWTSI